MNSIRSEAQEPLEEQRFALSDAFRPVPTRLFVGLVGDELEGPPRDTVAAARVRNGIELHVHDVDPLAEPGIRSSHEAVARATDKPRVSRTDCGRIAVKRPGTAFSQGHGQHVPLQDAGYLDQFARSAPHAPRGAEVDHQFRVPGQ